MTSKELLACIRSGEMKAELYEVSDNLPIRFSAEDKSGIYDLNGATVCAEIVFDAAATEITLCNATVIAASKGAAISVQRGASEICFSRLRVTGSTECAFALHGHDITLADCEIVGEKLSVGVYAEGSHSEISAAESDCYNILVARTRVTGAECSIQYQSISNGVILLNETETVSAEGCTYLYVAENRISKELTLVRNHYLLANGNAAASLSAVDNADFNGDNLTDLTERAPRGVNEKLIPHLNCEQFVGMKRKEAVRMGKVYEGKLAGYVGELLKTEDVVIVPPGAYINDGMLYENFKDKTVYAYGVLNEMPKSTATAFALKNCERITLKGLFIGNAIYPHTQGTVVELSGLAPSHADVLGFIPDPGYHADFSDQSNFVWNAAGRAFLPNMPYSYSCVDYENKRYDAEKNINYIENVLIKGPIALGHRVEFRNSFGPQGISFNYCSEIEVEDVTVYCASGFAESDGFNEIAPHLHRYAVLIGPAPLLDQNAFYDDRNGVTWTDAYGRLRSAKPLNTTIDATHSSAARRGIHIESCLLEMMEDDAGNINSYYGLALSCNPDSKALTYTTCDVNGYKLLPPPFRKGDIVMMYTMKGKLVGETLATGNTEQSDDTHYTVTLKDAIILPEGEKIVLQNCSASGDGFLIDNILQRNSKWSCFRFQSDCRRNTGVLKNSTFKGISTSGVCFRPEYSLWPEVGYVRNVQILDNEFIDLCAHSNWPHWEFEAICIPAMFEGGASPDPAYNLHRDIVFSGNLFASRYSRYAMRVMAVTNLKIENNIFTARMGLTEETDGQAPILIRGGTNIAINGNTYPKGVHYPVEIRPNAQGECAAGVTGNDLVWKF